jgi:hypothetical protein
MYFDADHDATQLKSQTSLHIHLKLSYLQYLLSQSGILYINVVVFLTFPFLLHVRLISEVAWPWFGYQKVFLFNETQNLKAS